MNQPDLFQAAEHCLYTADPDEKARLTRQYAARWREGELTLGWDEPSQSVELPGRPEHPLLVAPSALLRRRPNTLEGRAVLFHALTHIEFNAINLAWDAVYRFRGLPEAYYSDWVQVADEEAHHFVLLKNHLEGLGSRYGDFPAHDGLWDMAIRTAHDPMVRMALVPRCLEARGLDVNPGIKAKLLNSGDEHGAALLDVILHDEIGHVAIGNRWFHYFCAQRGLDPEPVFRRLVDEYLKGSLRGPFHFDARRRAGFSDEELAYLESIG